MLHLILSIALFAWLIVALLHFGGSILYYVAVLFAVLALAQGLCTRTRV